MKSNFQTSLDFVLEWECVFAPGHDGDMDYVISEDVPGDAGGLTKFGIDQRSHPNIDINNLTLEQAGEIYREEYWNKIRGDDLPEGYDLAVFDAAVNIGPGKAAQLLQLALGVDADGLIGPKTIQAAQVRGKAGLDDFLQRREGYYRSIATGGRQKFLAGWINRVNALQEAVA